jgi:D-alanyl-D-alanine carboxypeptidase (penicillin-binding protein 5/6)
MSKENAMNKKSLLGLILFACLITAALFAATTFLIGKDIRSDIKSGQISVTEEKTASPQEGKQDIKALPSSVEDAETADASENEERQSPAKDTEAQEEETTETYSTSIEVSAPELICDSKSVDYLSFIPEMVIDSQLEANLDISNPDIEVDATAAILFDADTGEVIYYKNAVQAMFPASTAKLLTALVALEWCDEEEEVTVGDEIKMIASDSTRAYLKEGEILTIRNLLAGMLLPSGNDAAYAMAAYVGRKSLRDPEASREEAVMEFARLMNKKAGILGAKNSCFKTPDGYDAVGQYTTAYDMGLIGMAAAANETITEISGLASSRNIFPSGQDVTWNNTNKLVKKYSGQYYSHAIGLKTGTSTMAGKCLIAAAKEEDQSAVCVILDSSSAGRWEDAIELLEYGLQH